MSFEMVTTNIILLVVLTFLVESCLRKSLLENSKRVTRIFWLFILPTCAISVIFTAALLFISSPTNIELLFSLQRYSIGGIILSCALFIIAIEGNRIRMKAAREKAIGNDM